MLRHTRSANALLLSLLTIAMLSSFAGIALQYTSAQAKYGRRSQEMNTAYAVADGVTEVLFQRWRAKMRTDTDNNFNVSKLVEDNVTNVSLSDVGVPGGEFFRIDRIALKHVDIYGRPQSDDLDINDAVIKQPTNGVPEAGKPYYRGAVPGTNSFTGFNIIYEARVWVTSTLNQSGGSPITVGVKRYFTKAISPTLQAAIFYNDQLEIHPGSNMTVNGLVHTNSSLYMCGYQGKSTLTLNEGVSYSGTYGEVSEADKSSIPSPSKPVYNSGTPARVDRMSIGGVDPDSLDGLNKQKLDKNGDPIPINYNDDSYRELIERPVRKKTPRPRTCRTRITKTFTTIHPRSNPSAPTIRRL